ncbi:MAG: hypothetical protein WD638_06010 [Nitriliruptoraceae bacterium]
MTRRTTPGFWRERLRGVGFLLALGFAVLGVAATIAWLSVLVLA